MAITLQHIHLRSKDKIKLAQWYCDHLDYKVIRDLEVCGEPNGPIYISPDQGVTGISIFTRDLKEISNILPAIGASPDDFFRLHQQFDQPRLYDHYIFISFYTHDLDQNKIEICCTQHDEIRSMIKDQGLELFLMNEQTYQG